MAIINYTLIRTLTDKSNKYKRVINELNDEKSDLNLAITRLADQIVLLYSLDKGGWISEGKFVDCFVSKKSKVMKSITDTFSYYCVKQNLLNQRIEKAKTEKLKIDKKITAEKKKGRNR